jgi:hypothetical protein
MVLTILFRVKEKSSSPFCPLLYTAPRRAAPHRDGQAGRGQEVAGRGAKYPEPKPDGVN